MTANFEWISEPFAASAKDIMDVCCDRDLVLCGDACARFIEEVGPAGFTKPPHGIWWIHPFCVTMALRPLPRAGFSQKGPFPFICAAPMCRFPRRVQRKIP